MKTLVTVSLRFPEPCRSAQGQSVPKVRPRGVADGKRVNIPVPTVGRYESEEGRRSKVTGGWWIPLQGGRRFPVGKSAGIVENRRRRGRMAPQRVADANCREKLRGPGLQ